jgi:hypothetical protein
MPQPFLPLFSASEVYINPNLAYKKEDGQVYYFNGANLPIFTHQEDDVQSFKMITSQFYVSGHATQAEIIKAFGIPPISMKRAVKTYRTKGPAGFYNKGQPRRKPRVLTPEVMIEVQRQLDEGIGVSVICNAMGLKQDTIQKAIRQGRLKKKT